MRRLSLNNQRKLRFIAIVLLFVPATANAAPTAVFKCTDAAGMIEYRDHPCDGGAGQKLPALDNSVGTGEDLAGIRAKSAELDARQAARQAGIDKANAERERVFLEERRHQDDVALDEAIHARNVQPTWGSHGYSGSTWMPPHQFRAGVKPARPSKPPSVPAKQSRRTSTVAPQFFCNGPVDGSSAPPRVNETIVQCLPVRRGGFR